MTVRVKLDKLTHDQGLPEPWCLQGLDQGLDRAAGTSQSGAMRSDQVTSLHPQLEPQTGHRAQQTSETKQFKKAEQCVHIPVRAFKNA